MINVAVVLLLATMMEMHFYMCNVDLRARWYTFMLSGYISHFVALSRASLFIKIEEEIENNTSSPENTHY